jgi:hypothetical protein
MHPTAGSTFFFAVGTISSRLAHFFPRWGALTALGLLVAVATAMIWRQRRPAPFVEPGSLLADYLLGRPDRLRDWILILLGCVGLLLAFDFHGFTRGFFREDDFAFVQDAREALPLSQQIGLYHADHSLPLYRVEVWSLVRLCGPRARAWDLAAAFNTVNFLTYLGVLLGGCWVLAELSARRAILAAFCLLVWLWPPWGEFTSGFYTISVYPQTLVFGFAAVAAELRGMRSSRGSWLGLSILAATVSAGLDISGVWVFPALAAFAWSARARPGRKTPVGFLFALAAVFALAAAYHLVLAQHPLAGRELVQNPGANLLAFGRPRIALLLSWKTVRGVISGLGGTLLSAVAPPAVQVLNRNFGAHPGYGTVLVWADLAATLGTGAVLWRYARKLEPPDQRVFLAVLWPVVLLVGMPVAARPGIVTVPGLLWPTKYLAVPYSWLVLAGVFLVDRLGFGGPTRSGQTLRRLAAIACIGVWLTVSQWGLERSLALTFAWFPGGRYHNSHLAARRRADFAAFQGDLERLASLTGTPTLALPPPNGGFVHFPYLEQGSSLVHGSNYIFTDLLAVAPNVPIKIIAAPAESISPATWEALRRIPDLDAFFGYRSGPPPGR